MRLFSKTPTSKILNYLIVSIILGSFCCVMCVSISAEEDRNPIRDSALSLIDNGEYKRAAAKLESLLFTDMSKMEKLEIHHVLGNVYEKVKNRPKAVGHYVRVITSDYPLADIAAFRLAKLYDDMNNVPKSIKWYTQLVNDYSTSVYQPEAKWNLAELHLNLKQYAQAKAILVDLIDHPTYARRSKYGLARCEEGLENYTEAFDIHQKLIRHKQSDTVADDAVGKLKMLARDHKSLKLTVEDRLFCGLVHYYRGNWKSAVNEFTPLTQSLDTKLKGRALYHLGLANQGRKWYNTATKNYNAVVALGSETDYLTRAHYQIAQCYRSKGSLTTAVNRLESFVKTYPWSELVDNALYDIAQIQEKRNKTELALNAYSRLIDVQPGSPYADWAAWRIGWQRFDEKRYEESYKAFEGLKDNFPGNRYAMGAHFWMAKIRERQNKPDLAQEIYNEVAKARYWYYSARAKAILRITASELEPRAVPDVELIQYVACPEHLSTILKLRLYEDGIYLLSHFIDNTATAAKECYYALVTCYEKLQRYDKAREVVDRALLSPSFANKSTDELARLRKLLYPLHYEKYVEKYSKQYNVESALIYAMILEESRYRSDAISWAGAIGLMQIMPATGRELARQLNIRRFRTSMLKIPEINIRMGTKYIGYLNSIFEGNAMLVSGAYNGGPGRMSRWLESKKIKDIDEFVEKITIRETRLHIKKVINSYDNYIEIYGQPEIPAVNSALGVQDKEQKTPILGKLDK